MPIVPNEQVLRYTCRALHRARRDTRECCVRAREQPPRDSCVSHASAAARGQRSRSRSILVTCIPRRWDDAVRSEMEIAGGSTTSGHVMQRRVGATVGASLGEPRPRGVSLSSWEGARTRGHRVEPTIMSGHRRSADQAAISRSVADQPICPKIITRPSARPRRHPRALIG